MNDEIYTLRNKLGTLDKKFHFSQICGLKWSKHDEIQKRAVTVAVDSMKNKRPEFFQSPLYCKLSIIFFNSPTPENLSLYSGNCKKEKDLRFIETMFRIVLKGAGHHLYSSEHNVKILKIITDGHPEHRELNEKRIINKLSEEQSLGKVKDYIDISETEIIHLVSNHKEHKHPSEEYFHANMLQVTDILLGSVMQSCFKGINYQRLNINFREEVKDKKSLIAYPVKNMLDKRKRGNNFKNSGHYKSFAISSASIIDEQWCFEDIMTKKIEIDNGQLKLF